MASVLKKFSLNPESEKYKAVLFGYFGFLDFYTGHPVKGISKLLLTISCIGIIVTFFLESI